MWLTGWRYRRSITINNSNNSNSLTDYQVLVILDTQSLISAGKMRNDGGDIRFTDSDGATLLNYWVESGINTSSTYIWVKVPSVPANSTKTIYVYYGNPSATSQSNGDNTFMFFDNFNNGLTKWTVFSGNSADFTINTTTFGYPVLQIHNTSNVEPKGAIRSNTIIGVEGIFEYNLNVASDDDFGSIVWVQGASNQPLYLVLHFGANILYWDGSNWSLVASGTSRRVANNWNREKVVFTSSGEIKAYTNANYIAGATGRTPISGYIGFRQGVTTRTAYVSLALVRKYTFPEPTTSVGEEEEIVILGTRRRLLLSTY
jgi:hypothetical protein